MNYIVSHCCNVASRVELFVGTRRLGHVSMSNNEKSSFRVSVAMLLD